MRFGDLLIRERVAKRISLRDLGKAVKLSPIYLSDMERCNRKPPAPPIIVRIAQALGADPIPLLRAGLKERDSVELPLGSHEGAETKREVALALARLWDQMDEDAFEELKQYLEGQRVKGA